MDQGIEKWRHHAIFSDLQYVYVICIYSSFVCYLWLLLLSLLLLLIVRKKEK